MFYGSDTHAESAAAIFSVIASCRLHSLDPEQYLDEVLRVLPVHAGTGAEALAGDPRQAPGRRTRRAPLLVHHPRRLSPDHQRHAFMPDYRWGPWIAYDDVWDRVRRIAQATSCEPKQ